MSELLPVIPSRGDLDWCWYLRRLGQSGEVFERALHDIGVMHPDGWADWSPSTMTNTGAPVEMHFSANQPFLSMRTEVDDPGKNLTNRTAKVCDVITTLGGSAPPAALRDVIGAAQSGADLRFGARLGLHRRAGLLGKTLYAELPPDTSDLVRLLPAGQIMPTLDKLGDNVRPGMLAYASLTGATTLYFETCVTPQDIVPQLVVPAGVSSLPLLDCLGSIFDDAGTQRTGLTTKLGFSYTFLPDGSAPILSLQLSAKALLKSDAKVSKLACDTLGARGSAYRVLVDQLSCSVWGKSYHGDITLQARPAKEPLFSIGVAAPWHCPFEMHVLAASSSVSSNSCAQ